MTDLISQHLDLWTSAIASKSSAGRGNTTPSPTHPIGHKGEGRGEGNPTSTRNAKYTAYGIKKLRELILELAVRGKLVPQDPNDEPASVLLERISVEKKRLIKEGKIKNQNPLPEINDDEKSFGLPSGWEWVRLQDVSAYIQRGKGPKYADQGQVRVISQKCIQWNGFDLLQAKYVDDDSITSYQPERFLVENDLLWNSTGTGTVGRINVLAKVKPNSLVADSHVTVIRPLNINSNFILCYISAPGIQQRIEPGSEKALVSGTTNQVELNTSEVIRLVVPIPPLAEQHRIVAKVDELMALCDQLEQQQADNIAAHQTLVQTLLDTLTQAADAAEFEQAWNRIADHFDTLFTTELSIDQLKQTLLQLAVMGRLVPQDLNDEPANNLLEKIAIKKNKLIKEKKIRRLKVLDQISQIDKPYILPRGWIWCRLEEFALFENGDRSSRYPNSSDLVECGVPFFGAPDIVNGKLEFTSELRFITMEKFSQLSNGKLVDRDFIILLRGSVGKIAQFYANTNHKTGFINAQMLIIRLLELDMAGYVNYFFKSDVFLTSISKSKSGAVIQQIPASEISKLIVPLPPLAEQHRIVAKVDELMALCDALKGRIAAAQTTQLQLADAIVEQAVA
ncbi:restriction endonuclease subunit S [Methylomonas sp. HW2-6]|uniref:restriction endonuclease subunit S n=1 Tax=Methylomonas sp. HW2-6 TaxID=3376687 RepID=UPI0040410B63